MTARAIAKESGANLASIPYHFGSMDALLGAAVIEGFDRWIAELESRLAPVAKAPPAQRWRRAVRALDASRRDHQALARAFVGALGMALHDASVRRTFAAGFARARVRIAALLGLGSERADGDVGALAVAMLDGLLIQMLVDPEAALGPARLQRALARMAGSIAPRV